MPYHVPKPKNGTHAQEYKLRLHCAEYQYLYILFMNGRRT